MPGVALETLSGLSRHTALRGLARLKAAGSRQGPRPCRAAPLCLRSCSTARQFTPLNIQMGISVARGIRLVAIHPEDLTLASVRKKVDSLLLLRSPDGRETLIGCLGSVSRAYRRKARRGCRFTA